MAAVNKDKKKPKNAKSGRPKRVTVGAYDWLMQFGESLKSKSGVPVPCGDCNACCRAGYAVRTDDGKLYLPQSDGSCSELKCGQCSVYKDRPRTCEYYDCRTHLFSRINPGKPAITEAIKGWHVDKITERDQAVLKIIKTVADVLVDSERSPEDVAVQSCLIAYERICKLAE
jgi:hypothetical protein